MYRSQCFRTLPEPGFCLKMVLRGFLRLSKVKHASRFGFGVLVGGLVVVRLPLNLLLYFALR